MQNISVVGYGKVGKALVSALSKATFIEHVFAIDSVPMEGATTNYDAMLGTDITFVIVPTPSLSSGDFSNKHIYDVALEINKRFAGTDHLVALNSTVSPETTMVFKNLCGCKVCYNPFFIRQGTIEEDILNPDFVLIGEDDEQAGDELQDFYKNLLSPKIKPIIRTNYVNAELTKIALNTFTTVKMSFVNSLGDLCEKIDGADISVITDALQNYHSIGRGNLTASVRYGGPCLPRDNKALLACAKKYKVNLPLAKETDKINNNRTDKLVKMIKKVLPKNGKVLILGMTYKPDTRLIEESQGTKLYEALTDKKIKVDTYDPMLYQPIDTYVNNLLEADVVVITTPHRDFELIKPEQVKKTAWIIDCWRILKGRFNNYITIGKKV